MAWPISPDFVVVNAATGAALNESRRRQTEWQQQLTELRQQLATLRDTQVDLEDQLREARARLASQESELRLQGDARRDLETKKERQVARIQDLNETLNVIYSSKSWRLLTMWRQFKYAILPKPRPRSSGQ